MKNVLEVISLSTHKDIPSFKVQIPEDSDGAAVEEVKVVQMYYVVPVRFPAKRRDAAKHFLDALLIGESNISQRDIRRWLSTDGLCTGNKGWSSSCWKARDNSGSWDEGLFVVDHRKKGKN